MSGGFFARGRGRYVTLRYFLSFRSPPSSLATRGIRKGAVWAASFALGVLREASRELRIKDMEYSRCFAVHSIPPPTTATS